MATLRGSLDSSHTPFVTIAGVRPDTVVIENGGRLHVLRSPVLQAREYTFAPRSGILTAL